MKKMLFINELLQFFDKKDYNIIKNLLLEANPISIGVFLEKIAKNLDDLIYIVELIPDEKLAEILIYIDKDLFEVIVYNITDKRLKEVINYIFVDDAVDFILDANSDIVTKILKNTDNSKREIINKFLNYSENSAGSIMTVEYVEFNIEETVSQSLDIIKSQGKNKKTIYSCYVVDDNKVLKGVVSLKNIIFSKDEKFIKNIMNTDFISVNVNDDREYTAQLFKKYSLIAMPVIDKENKIVGIITIDDVVDVIDEENTEDIEKMSALTPSEYEYLKTSVWTLAKNRITWLLILMISGTITGTIIGKYETLLSSMVVLTAFVPLLMDTGGNAGSQSSTLIIRGIALGEININDIFKVIFKELQVGFLCGLVLGFVNFVRLIIIKPNDIIVNITVSLSIMFVVVVAKTVGCILPIIAKKLNFDPAIMAGPLITTIVDAVALLIFFNFAKLFIF